MTNIKTGRELMNRKISDLTKDTRPSMEDLLLNSVQDVIEIDKKKANYDGDRIAQENNTFYYRVIYLFMQKVDLYYTHDEIKDWSKVELLQEAVLPKINNFKSNI